MKSPYDIEKRYQENKKKGNYISAYDPEFRWKVNNVNKVKEDINNRVQNWANNYQSFVNSHYKRFETPSNNYRADADRWASYTVSSKMYFDKEANEIRKLLDEYKDFFVQDEWAGQVLTVLAQGEKGQSEIVNLATKDMEYWSNWDSEDAYKKALAEYEDYTAKANFDLDAEKKTIDELKIQIDTAKKGQNQVQALKTQIAQNENKLRTMGRYDLNAQKLEKQIEQDKATLAQLESQYGYLNVDALEKRLARKEQYYVLASRVQEGERLASVVNNADFEYFSEKGMNVENPTFGSIHNDYYDVFGFSNADELNDRILNKVTFVKDNEAEAVKASKYFSTGNVDPEMPYYNYLLNQMKDEEVKIYSYYVGKGDYETADRYLETLADTLAARQAGTSFEEIEGRTGLELVFGIAAGLDQFMQGLEGLGNAITGEEDYVPSSVMQHLSGMVRDDIANSDSKFWGAIGTVGYDILNTTANMLPSILVSQIPVVGGALGSFTLGASAAGNAYNEMINSGFSKGQARTYASLIGGSEAGLQYLLGGITSLGGVANKGLMQSILSNVDKAFARTAIQIGGSMASEFTEEAIQSILEPWFKSLVTNTDFEAPGVGEVLYSGLLGALTAGVLEGPTTIAGTMQTASKGRQIKGREGAVERLKNLGSTLSPESVAYKLAGKVNENTGAYTIGRLFYEAGAQVNAQNKADIEKSLTRKGISAKDANIISNAFEDIVNGAELTKSQKAMFNSNPVVARTFLDILINPNHTVNQRRMGLAEVAGSLKNTPQISMRDTKPTADTTQQATEGVEGFITPKSDNLSSGESGVELSRFKVSEDGVTRVSGSTEGIEIAYVEDIKDGNILLRTTDGRTVNADDVFFKDKETAYLYETLADMGISTPAEANRIIRGYDPNADITLEEYARGVYEAYQYGAHGYAVTDISSKGMAALLSEEQRAEAHLSGRNTVWIKTMEQQAAINKEREEAVALGVKPKTGGVYFGNKVATESDVKGKLRKNSLKGLTFLAEVLGADFHLFESYKNEKGKIVFKNAAGNEVLAPNGWMNADGSIWIDINSGNDGKGTMLYTAAHELTHFIQRFSPAKYQVLCDFIVEKYSSNGKDFTTEVALKMERAKAYGRKIGEREAFNEVIADACSTMLLDSNAFRELASRDKTLAGKIKEFLEKFVAKIRAAYEKLSPDAREARFLRSLKEGLDEISAIWSEALVDAGETYRTIGERFSDVSEAKNTDGEQLFQYRAMESDKEIYREMLIKHGLMTDAEIDSLFNTIDKALAVITSHLEELDFAWDVDIDDRAFMPVKPNSDSLYQVSLDFSTLCRKRLLQQTIQATLQEALNRPLSKDEAIEIRNELMKVQEEGRQIEIACALCYVESARMKSPEQIKKFINNKEDLLKEFFAGKAGGTTKEKIAQAETRARQELNSKYNGKMPGKNNAELNPLTAKLNQMQKKDADVIRDAKKEAKKAYQPTAEQSALIEKAKEMTVNDFTTPDGLENLAKNYPLLFEAYTSYVRNATKSKGIEKDTWWRAGDSAVLIGDSLIEKMNAENGLRTQSWSDFQVIHILDYIASTIELSTRNSKMQAYTKVPDYVVLMGKTGTMINLSLIPTRSYLGELDYDSVEGMDYKEAKRLRNKYPETVGTVCIGINNEQIRKLLADFTIDYVIPYHKSGMSQDTRIKMHIPEWVSYEEFQSESKLSRTEAERNAEKYNAKLLPETDENYHKAPKFSEWFDIDLARKEAREANEREGKDSSDIFGGYEAMRNAANTYKRLCAERGLTPKFSHEKADFTSEPNYWKLLIDRKMINHKTGEIIEQKAIKPIFDTKDVLGILNREVKRYAQVKEDQDYAARIVTERFLEGKRSLDKNEQNAIKKTVDNVTNVNIYESAPLIDVSATQRSERDQTYLDAVNRGDTETAQRMVDEAAKAASFDSPKLYHGTPKFGFTTFDTSKGLGLIYATTKSNVAANYAGRDNYAFARDIGKKYISPDSNEYSLDPTGSVIQNAESVLGTKYRVLDDADREAIRDRVHKEAGRIVQMLDDKFVEFDTSDDIANSLSWAVGLFYEVQENQNEHFSEDNIDREWSLNSLKESIAKFNEHFPIVREYLSDNYQDLSQKQKEYAKLFLGYDLFDTAVDIEYQYYQAANPTNEIQLIASETNQGITTRESLQEKIALVKDIGAYALYGRVGNNPLEVDAGGREWVAIKVPEMGDNNFHSTDAVAKWAKEKGYTSVLFKNVYDGGEMANEYVFFSSEQVKSADPVTYDDNGNVIPLSQRFNSSETDIRFSERDQAQIEQEAEARNLLGEEISELDLDVKELNKLVKDTKAKISESAETINKVARMLMEENAVKGRISDLAPLLKEFYSSIENGDMVSWEAVNDAAAPVVEWLQKHYGVEDAYAKGILTDLRKRRIYLDETQRAEVASTYGSYKDFLRKAMGRVIIANTDSVSLDTAWQELSGLYPEYFDAETNTNDMPAKLMEIVDTLQGAGVRNEYFMAEEMAEQALAMQVYDSYWKAATLNAVSENTKKLSAKHRNKMQELRKKHKANEDKLRSRYQTMLKNARERAQESRGKTELRSKIKKEVKALNKLLLRGTKDKHVMDNLQGAVAEALDAINMDTVGASERIYGYVDENGKTHKGYNRMIEEARAQGNEELVRELTATRDRIAKQGDGLKSKLQSFKIAYESIKKSNDPEVASLFYDEILGKIDSVVEDVGNTPLRFMTTYQLESVLDLYKMVHKVIRDSNKAFRAEKFAKITETAENVASQVYKQGGEKEYMSKVGRIFNRLGFSMLKPEYFFKMLGSETMLDLYHNLRKGEDTFFRDIEEGKKFFDTISEKYKYREWVDSEPKEFKSASGKTFKLSVEEMMSIYAYTRRDLEEVPGKKKLDAKKHLTEGGIVLTEDVAPTRKFGLGKILGYTVNTKRAYRLKPETVGEIVASLKEEQKSYVEEMQEFLSSVMGAKGNEVTMELFGIKGFKEKYYFPIKSSSYYMGFKPQEAGEVRIKNPSFSKDRVPNANNPVVLTGFTDVWKKHVEDMSMYHSFTLPLEDFTRVYNYGTKSAEDTDTTSVKATIASAYGEGATDYIEKFLRDLNGGVRTEKADILDSMISLSKKGSVMASASVVVQQYSALTRAFALVDPKYFVKTLPQGFNLKNHSKDWEELKRYAPIAGIKEMGRFDTGMGRSTGDWIASKQTVRERMDDILSKAPAFADEVVWVQIWQAVKRETVHNNPNLNPKSEEFLQKAGERFTEVVSLTQVYDSVFSRSGMMRSQNTLMKMATAFMAEPTVQLNMLADGIIQGKKLGLKMGTLYASRVAGSVASSLVLNAALKSIVMAARDDDEDETYAEKYVEAFSGDLIESINPLTMIPIAKDILSIFKGYEVKRMDMNLFSDLVRAFENLDRENISQPEKWADLAGAISAFFGVPLKNVKRDIMSVINVITTVASDNKTTAKGLRDAILEGITGEGKSVTDKLYEAISSGDEAYLKEVQKELEGKNYSTYVRKALRENDARIREAAEADVRGDVDERVRITREIIAEGNFGIDDVIAAINTEANAIRNATAKDDEVATTETEAPGTTSVYKNSDVITAFESGDTSLALEIIDELVDVHMSNGKTEKEAKSSIRSSMTSKLKPLYIAADSETRKEIRFFMRDSGLYGRSSDILDTCKNWLKDA